MDVGVNANPFLAESFDEHEVGRFSADSWQLQQGIQIVGHAATMPREELFADGLERLRLSLVEADGADSLFGSTNGQSENLIWSFGKLPEVVESPRSHDVARPEREDGRNQHRERISKLLLHPSHDRLFAALFPTGHHGQEEA